MDLKVLIIATWLIHSVAGFAIDNEVVGIPQVQCSEDAVTFAIRTRNPFAGNIYIKGKFTEPSCRQEFFSNTFNGASFTVRIPLCGMRRIRQLQPQGMNYILVFVVSFHPQFETKIDRAYNVRCFYAQQEKTVTSQLEVSMLATQSLEAATMLMPNCEYSIRSGSLNGPRVRFVRVGDRLVHRWECDNPNFGMLIKNCFVSDGFGSSVRVLDNRGCPVFTPVIQGPLQYDNSLNLAYVEVWAYKFPDRMDLYFQCQVQVCNKRENECVGVTPPNCPLLPPPAFTPSSVVEPGVTGPYGPVTVVHGTFERPFPGQEVIGPYPAGQPALPAPQPYGPPFGQQVVPGQPVVVPGALPAQPVAVPGAFPGQPVAVPGAFPGQPVAVPGALPVQPVAVPGALPAYGGYPGVASDQGPNASGVARPVNTPEQQQPSGSPSGHGRQSQFNSQVRNDASEQNPPDILNSTLAAPATYGPSWTGNATRNQRRYQVRGTGQHERRKTRREVDENGNEEELASDADNTPAVTKRGPVAHNAEGDGNLMDVTADVVYVGDVGDTDAGEDWKRYPFGTVSSSQSRQVCLNPLAFSLLFVCLAVLVVIIGLLLLYLLMRVGKWPLRAQSGDRRKWQASSTLSASTLGPGDKSDQPDEPQGDDTGPSTGAIWSDSDLDTSDKKLSMLASLWSALPNVRLPRLNRKRFPIL